MNPYPLCEELTEVPNIAVFYVEPIPEECAHQGDLQQIVDTLRTAIDELRE